MLMIRVFHGTPCQFPMGSILFRFSGFLFMLGILAVLRADNVKGLEADAAHVPVTNSEESASEKNLPSQAELIVEQLRQVDGELYETKALLEKIFKTAIAETEDADTPSFHKWMEVAMHSEQAETRNLAMAYDQASRRQKLLINKLVELSQSGN